jgi:hypothetical protein
LTACCLSVIYRLQAISINNRNIATSPPPIIIKDIYVDPISKTPILLVGDKLSIPTRTLADANMLAPISVSDIPPPTKTTIAPPVVGAPIVTREQQITTISTTLSTRNLKLR